jgi:signal transduction histidine kinase
VRGARSVVHDAVEGTLDDPLRERTAIAPDRGGVATSERAPQPETESLVGPSTLPEDLRSILAGIAAGVTVQDDAGRLLFANEDAARLGGFASPAEMLTATPGDLVARYELVDLEGRPFDRAMLPGRRALAGEMPEPVLLGFRRLTDGKERWSMIQARAATLADGRRIAVNTFHDVTPRIETERRIRASELRTRELADARRRDQDIARMLADTALRLEEARDVTTVVTAVVDASIPVLADWSTVDLLEPDGSLRIVAARSVQTRPLRLDVTTGGPIGGLELVRRRVAADGLPLVLPDTISTNPSAEIGVALADALEANGVRGLVVQPLLVRGDVVGTIAYATLGGRTFDGAAIAASVEVAKRAGLAIAEVQAQERLRGLAASEHARAAELNAVIRAMGDGLVVCDPTGRIILSNPAAEDVFPEVDETTYGEILAQLDDPDGIAPRLGARGGPVQLRVRSGDERWIEISTWPVAAGRDHARREEDETIVLLRDVTDQRQRQAVRDTFIGVLSHELRTPVTTIFAGAKVLARPSDLSDSTRQEIFGDIVIESERLHRLVEDVVAMTRFEDESEDVGTEPVLLQRLLPGVVASEVSRWPGVRFDAAVASGLPTVIADPTYVEQVVRNLLSNAAKYGGPGANVTARVEAVHGEVVVRILDDGPGFPPNESDRLFELFFRSSGTARAAAGAGIGLFVCARLIRAMGGRIWATNRPEGGAEFGFALRVMDEND